MIPLRVSLAAENGSEFATNAQPRRQAALYRSLHPSRASNLTSRSRSWLASASYMVGAPGLEPGTRWLRVPWQSKWFN